MIGGFGVTAADLLAKLDEVEDGQDIEVLIHSPGGFVSDGLAIYNALAERDNVTVKIVGIAASAASMIAMAGKRIEIAKNGFLMFHPPSGMAIGGSEKLRDVAALLDTMSDTFIEIYTERTGMSEAGFRLMFESGDQWLNSTEAKMFGFVDAIGPARKFDVKAEWALEQHYSNVPTALIKPPEGKPTPPKEPEAMPPDVQKTPEDMAKEDIAAILGDDAAPPGSDPATANGDDYAMTVFDLCELAGRSNDDARKLIQAKVPLAKVRAYLLDFKAAQSPDDIDPTAPLHRGKGRLGADINTTQAEITRIYGPQAKWDDLAEQAKKERRI